MGILKLQHCQSQYIPLAYKPGGAKFYDSRPSRLGELGCISRRSLDNAPCGGHPARGRNTLDQSKAVMEALVERFVASEPLKERATREAEGRLSLRSKKPGGALPLPKCNIHRHGPAQFPLCIEAAPVSASRNFYTYQRMLFFGF